MERQRWLPMALVALACAFLTSGCKKPLPTSGQDPQTNGGNVSGEGNVPGGGGRGGAVGGGGGAVQNIRQAAKRVADGGELKNFALAYVQYALLNNRGPSQIEDLQDSLTPKMVEAFRDKELYAVNWKIANPSGNTILAYVKEPDSYGTRLVAKGDGTVTRMNKDEFEAAIRGGR